MEKGIRGFFDPELFLDYMPYFVLFEDDGDALIKKIAGYHQFHGVREAVRVTTIASADSDQPSVRERRATYGDEVQPGSRKAGVFWHTQGSGKSISMCCYAGKLLQQPAMKNPTLVVVTDRNELDGQLYQQFCMAKDLLKQTPEQANSREELREMLAERESGGIIFTTVQKFSLLDDEDEHPLLCDRSNVVVISDEAHRSEYGLKARLNRETGKYVFGYAKHMRDALPSASFIGFTGTPIDKEDKDTRGVFGDYVSIYDIQDAVDDGATVPIYYESRLVKIDINRADIDALNKDVDEAIEDEEDVAAREKTKGRWAELTKPVASEPRLAEVAADLDRLGSRRWSLVCVLDPQIPSASLTTLLARIRDLHAVKVLHLDRCTRWSLADSLALGFSQLASGCSLLGQHGTMVDLTAFEFEIRNYKQVPDWLNAKNWANPELWGKHSW